jgi:hypothetical protein
MPAQHSITAPIRFIPRADPAWDLDVALAELDGLQGEDHSSHPLVAYFSGSTRFDLDALGGVVARDVDGAKIVEQKTPRAYLKPESRPTIWTLRRLKMAQVAALLDAPEHQAQLSAFAAGFVAVENGPPEIADAKGVSGLTVPASVLEQIGDAVGSETVFAVGAAVLLASQAPTSAEKKH